jgi:hypothetical protein
VVLIASCHADERNKRAIDSASKNLGSFQGYDYPIPNQSFTLPP